MDSAVYTDLIKFFRTERLSVISIHELPGNVDVFKNFYRALDNCSFSLFLLTKQFLAWEWSDKRVTEACERAVRKREESVLFVKEAGFDDDEVPCGLLGISGLDHSSRFFRSSLRNTFQDLPRLQMEQQGNGTPHVYECYKMMNLICHLVGVDMQ